MKSSLVQHYVRASKYIHRGVIYKQPSTWHYHINQAFLSKRVSLIGNNSGMSLMFQMELTKDENVVIRILCRSIHGIVLIFILDACISIAREKERILSLLMIKSIVNWMLGKLGLLSRK